MSEILSKAAKFHVIAIRNLNDNIPFHWNGSYYVGNRPTLSEAIELAENEKLSRGHKYGCVVYAEQEESTESFVLSR